MTRSVFLILFSILSTCAAAQEIAITFDDAPIPNGPLFSGDERARRLIQTLQKYQVKEAAFFVLTKYADIERLPRLKQYSDAGHLLANHSHRHLWIHEAGTREYIRDIGIADSILSAFPNYQRWYRYPFLDEGRTKSARDSIRQALSQMELRNGYVTIDNYDWYLNSLLAKAMEANKKVNRAALRDVYVEHICNSVSFYDAVAREHLGRSPRHVLLLHENDLAALFLEDVLERLKQEGWKFISAREAYEDPIASHVPDVLFNGQGRVAAIANEKGIRPRDLVQESEDEEYLDKVVTSRKVFK